MNISGEQLSSTYKREVSSKPANTASTNADFQTFLKMLTAQITHQDPLNPMEGSDFAVQLATFSSVEQQAQTNSLLQSILDMSGADQLVQLSNLIGREVLTNAPVYFSGQEVEVFIPEHENQEGLFFVASNSRREEVSRYPLLPNETKVLWPNIGDQNGNALPHGQYSFHLEELQDDRAVRINSAGYYTEVTGADTSRSGTQLVLTGGVRISPDEVLAVR